MRLLKTFYKTDAKEFGLIRKASRGIIRTKDNKYVLIYSKHFDDYSFPGGGIDDGESRKVALLREVLEEAGAIVSDVSEFGRIVEYRPMQNNENKAYKLISYFYTCNLEKLTKNQLEDYEVDLGYETRVISLEEALEHNLKRLGEVDTRKSPLEREIFIMKKVLSGYRRGFKVARGFENYDIEIPVRKTKESAGYDLSIIEDIEIEPGKIVFAKTGLKAYMQEDEVLMLYIRSSLGCKKGIMLANSVGVIDSDYYENPDNDGHIMCALLNTTQEVVKLCKGERVAQGIFTKYLKADNDFQTAERNGGFGSTNK